jgi:hypothetical protein
MSERIIAQPASKILVRGELTFWVHVGRAVGLIALVVGAIVGLAGPVGGWIVAAVGAVLWLWLEAVAFHARRTRTWLTMQPDGFVVEDRNGSRAIKDAEIVAVGLYTKRNFNNADVASITRTFHAWTERDLEPVVMHGTIKTGQYDPVQPLIDRLHDAALARMEEDLGRGLTIGGDGWRMNRIGLSTGRPPNDLQLPLSDITAIDYADGKLCVWRRGQDEAAIKLLPGGRNAYLLPALLAKRIAPQGGEPGAESQTGLGRILFQRKPSTGVILGLLIGGGFMAMIGAVLMCVPNQATPFFTGIGLILLGAILAGLAWAMKFMNFRVHERGVWQSSLLGQKQLRYKDVGTFRYQAVDHYHNGAYVGTHLTLDFRPISKELGPRIRYSANVRGKDDDLEGLRDQVSRAIAVNMAELYNAGQPVFWTSNLQFLPEGIRYRPAGVFGRKEPLLLPYADYGGYDFKQGVFYLFARNNPKAICAEPTNAENFFPGFFLLLLLLHTPAEEAETGAAE